MDTVQQQQNNVHFESITVCWHWIFLSHNRHKNTQNEQFYKDDYNNQQFPWFIGYKNSSEQKCWKLF